MNAVLNLEEIEKKIEEKVISSDVGITLDDVFYDDDKDKKVEILISPNHTFEDVKNIANVRKTLSTKTVRSSREITTRDNAISALDKVKDYDALIKKLKTLIKFSSDIDFPYLMVVEKIKNMPFYEEYHYESEQMTDEILQKVIVTQTVTSLEHYSIIHPKIKLLINLIGKLNDVDTIDGQPEDGSLTFNV